MEQMLIVHPTDLRAESEGAFDHALKLGLAERAHLNVVHAHTYAEEDIPRFDAFPRVRQTLARWGLLAPDAPQTDVGDKLGLRVTKGELGTYDPEAAMAKLLRDEEAAMVVLGTRALDGLKRLFEDSFSERLARDARIPALFVPNGAAGFVDADGGTVRMRRVLLPVAQDPDPTPAVAAALKVADLLGVSPEFHLLHVGEPGSVREPSLPGRKSHLIVRQGPVVETIVEVADAIDADLIVMATAGHKSFLDALRGSTTEGVVRKAHRALLAIPVVTGGGARTAALKGPDRVARLGTSRPA